jgi:hypothetical protein
MDYPMTFGVIAGKGMTALNWTQYCIAAWQACTPRPLSFIEDESVASPFATTLTVKQRKLLIGSFGAQTFSNGFIIVQINCSWLF